MKTFKLGQLKKGERGVVLKLLGDRVDHLRELGLLEGVEVEVAYEAPFSKDPIAIRVRGALLAMRRKDANEIEVSHA